MNGWRRPSTEGLLTEAFLHAGPAASCRPVVLPTIPDCPMPRPCGHRHSAALAAVAGLALSLAGPARPAEPTTYVDLAPLFQARCTACHAGAGPAAGLALDSLDGIRRGSHRGPVVTPGDPARSALVRRLNGQSEPRMPLTGPPWVAASDIARVERWIADGLPSGAALPDRPPAAPPSAVPVPGQPVTWQHVAPILATRCMHCHAPQGRLGPPPEGYSLTSHQAAVSADDRARVVPGRPEASELLRRVRGHAQPRMPLDGPPWLDAWQVQLLARWVADGARDAEGRPTPVPVGARVRLRGVVSPDGSLDGLPLPVGGRRDKLPQPGDPMELRGRLAADGSIEVERLRRR